MVKNGQCWSRIVNVCHRYQIVKDVQLWSRKVGNSKVQECAEVLKYGQGCFRRVKDGKGLPNISKKALFWEVFNGEGRSRMFKIV